MRLSSHTPSPELAPYVRAIRVVETETETTRVLLPETGINVGFRYRGSATELAPGATPLPTTTIAGLRRVARRMQTSADGGAVIVNFRDGGAAAFFSEPLHELFGTTADLADLVPASSLDHVRAELAATASSEQRVRVVECFLRSRLRQERADPLVDAALRSLTATHGRVRIEQLARELEVSPDRLEKRFRHRVGSTPKQHASLLRLRRAVELYRPGQRLADLALDAGYFDQAHFNHDFRAFAGTSPQRFFSAREFC
jgi:AraC-like DNA-binding protein